MRKSRDAQTEKRHRAGGTAGTLNNARGRFLWVGCPMKSEKDVQPSNVTPRCATTVVDYVAVFGFGATVSQPATTLDLVFDDARGSFDTTISVGSGIRVEVRDRRHPGFLTAGQPALMELATARSGVFRAQGSIADHG